MSVKLKKLSEQVVVITGASSGIGLATAEAAATAGAKVVLAARSETTLRAVAGRLGGNAVAVGCDVTDRGQVERLASAALEQFGRIDTWVNNAGLGMYGRLEETDEADARRLFDVNFWGVVNGCRAALPHLRTNGGALVTVGSEVSDAFVPLLGIYVASKHAVKGYIDCLRVEVEDVDKAPVSVTLIQPTAVDTPFPQHARNYMSLEPMLPQPTIDPTEVSAAILHAAEHPTRAKAVGGKAVMNIAMSRLVPGLADGQVAKMAGQMQYDEPPRNPAGALRQSSEAVGVAGRTHGTGGKKPK
jgi:NADP-dependent 3-hydroxy acid dehydrogenase YdfG